MTIPIWISVLALIISSGSLALQLKKWLEEGPRLHLSVMADAVMFPVDDKKPKLVLTVINRGSTPTLITHMIAFTFDSSWKRFRNKPSLTGVVNSTLQPVPFNLGVNQSFMGMMTYDDKLMKARVAGTLYIGVISSHTNKNFLIGVPPPKPEPKLTAVGA